MRSGSRSGLPGRWEGDGRGSNVPERDVCLVVSASSWFEISEESRAPDLQQAEYRLRCRILVEGAQSIVAHIFGLADTSGRFRRLVPPLLKPISKDKIMREEAWHRDVA
jgi:hypothetical protein